MATKYFCDGCDDVIVDYTTANQFTINVTTDGTAKTHGIYDLCRSCSKRLIDHATPKRWQRPARVSEA